MKIATKIFILVLLLSWSWGPSFAMGQLFFLENSLVGQPAPDFSLESFQGQRWSLKEVRGDSPAIIFFWATWCPHCRDQLKDLNRMGPAIEQKGIKIIVVDIGETAGEVKTYVERNKIRFDVLLDEETRVSEQYSVLGVPTFIYLTADGIIRVVEHELAMNWEEILCPAQSCRHSSAEDFNR